MSKTAVLAGTNHPRNQFHRARCLRPPRNPARTAAVTGRGRKMNTDYIGRREYRKCLTTSLARVARRPHCCGTRALSGSSRVVGDGRLPFVDARGGGRQPGVHSHPVAVDWERLADRLADRLASAQREAWGVEGGVGWDGTPLQRGERRLRTGLVGVAAFGGDSCGSLGLTGWRARSAKPGGWAGDGGTPPRASAPLPARRR